MQEHLKSLVNLTTVDDATSLTTIYNTPPFSVKLKEISEKICIEKNNFSLISATVNFSVCFLRLSLQLNFEECDPYIVELNEAFLNGIRKNKFLKDNKAFFEKNQMLYIWEYFKNIGQIYALRSPAEIHGFYCLFSEILQEICHTIYLTEKIGDRVRHSVRLKTLYLTRIRIMFKIFQHAFENNFNSF
jgi:hypothetical protein